MSAPRRGAIPPEALDTTHWAAVAFTELPKAEQAEYRRREHAVNAYVAGGSVQDILKKWNVSPGELYRWLRRCIAAHPDGRVFGYRGLLAGRHVVPRRRKNPVVISKKERGSRGAAGAFAQLLEDHPRLRGWLEQQVQSRATMIDTLSTDGGMRLRDLSRLHARFLERCRDEGLGSNDYPLNTKTGAVRTLALTLKAMLMERFSTAARAAGALHLKGGAGMESGQTLRYVAEPATRPYQVVEFDAHRVDLRLKCVTVDPLGFVHEFEIERVWLLVLLDQYTRCVLGYHVVLGAEYSRFDVIQTVERALEPHRARAITIPGLRANPKGGFPSGVLPELAYACWESLHFDNARANLAEDTLSVLTEFVGCYAEAGPAYHPDERPYIERFFGTLTRSLAHRLPGSTGSNPKGARRFITERTGDTRLLVSIDELDQLFEVAIADYNGAAHEGLNGRAPLELMHYAIRRKHELPRWVSEPRRRALCLMQTAHRSIVRADPARGVRPYVSLWGVRYTNPELAATGALVGERLRVYLQPEDMRTARAFREDGTEFGTLRAAGIWGATAHDLRLRKEILKLRRKNALPTGEWVDSIDAYLEYKRKEARRSRRAGSDLARVERLIEAGVIAKTPSGTRGVPPASSAPQGAVAAPSTTTGRSLHVAISDQALTGMRAFAARLTDLPGERVNLPLAPSERAQRGEPLAIQPLDIPPGFVV